MARPTKHFDKEDLDDFVRGYVMCAIFFEPLPEPEEGEDWQYGEAYDEAGFGFGNVDKESLKRVRAACVKFLRQGAHLIPGGRLSFSDGTEMEHAGHDAAMSAQGYMPGFDETRWRQPAGAELEKLTGYLGWEMEPHRGKVIFR